MFSQMLPTTMNDSHIMNEGQSFGSLKCNRSRYLSSKSSGSTFEPWTVIELLNARAANLAHYAEMMAIWSIDEEMVQHAHNVSLPLMVVRVPQLTQHLDLWTISGQPCGEDLQGDISQADSVSGKPYSRKSSVSKFMDHDVAAFFEGIIQMNWMEASGAVVQCLNLRYSCCHRLEACSVGES